MNPGSDGRDRVGRGAAVVDDDSIVADVERAVPGNRQRREDYVAGGQAAARGDVVRQLHNPRVVDGQQTPSQGSRRRTRGLNEELTAADDCSTAIAVGC